MKIYHHLKKNIAPTYHNFRLYTGTRDSAMYDILTSLPYQKVMKNNIDLDESFNSFETSITKTLNSSSNTAFFYLKSAVSENEMNIAKVIYLLHSISRILYYKMLLKIFS